MKIVRAVASRSVLAALVGVAGLALIVVSAACGGDDKAKSSSSSNATGAAAAAEDSPTATPSPRPTQVPTPTPTPMPFDGEVARMKIPSLGVDYPIEKLALKANNEMDTPHDTTGKIGWYYIYDKPGFHGNAFFSAHVNYNGKDGPFAKLAKSVVGDEIDVQMADGPAYTYKIIRKQRYDVATIDMGALLTPKEKPEGAEWITLMTCSCDAGRVVYFPNSIYGKCLDRDVVVAQRVT